jgi:hypothetical protein
MLVKAYPNCEVGASLQRKKPLPPPSVRRFCRHHVAAVIAKVKEVGIENCLLLVKNGTVRVGQAEPLGLSSVAMLRAKKGSSGLTRHGKRMIECGAALIDQRSPKNCQSFLTLTLPPSYDPVTQAQAFLVAKNRFMDSLRRNLVRVGLNEHICGVVEPHPGRSEREGCMVPHIHLVFQGRLKGRTWAFSPSWYRDLWWRCLCNAGIAEPSGDSSACVRVERVEKSVAKYLSKYMAKTRSRLAEALPETRSSTNPGVWHIVTRTLLRLIRASTKIYSGLAGDYAWDWICDPSNKYVLYKGDVFIDGWDSQPFWIGGYAKLTPEGLQSF